jgi:hypothetical protein
MNPTKQISYEVYPPNGDPQNALDVTLTVTLQGDPSQLGPNVDCITENLTDNYADMVLEDQSGHLVKYSIESNKYLNTELMASFITDHADDLVGLFNE